jgi:hypothetical protein
MIKKLTLTMMVLFATLTANAHCDWNGYWMKKVNQQQNYYVFQTNVDWDSCIDYQWLVYDHQLKRTDSLQDFRGLTPIQFNKKGKYTVMLHVTNSCHGCDTTFKYDVNLTIYGHADATWTNGVPHNCAKYYFTMTEFDTCVEYYYTIYKSSYFYKIDWKRVTDSALYNDYSFDQADIVYYTMTSERTLTHEFIDTGRHLVVAYWWNKCSGIDTFVIRKLSVCTKSNTSGLSTIVKPEPKLIGIYDVLGRPVKYIRKDEILIYLYDDGKTKKVYIQ